MSERARTSGCPACLAPLVLASASPRRRDILQAAGWAHEILPADIDERAVAGESPLQCAERLAVEKALSASQLAAGRPEFKRSRGILAGDTIVELDGELFGKPEGRSDAESMLRKLSGNTHRVASSVALLELASGRLESGVHVSEVRFDQLSDQQLERYLDSDEWQGKAGAYAIQGDGGDFAHLISGQMDTVIGLPMALVLELGRRWEHPTGAGKSA